MFTALAVVVEVIINAPGVLATKQLVTDWRPISAAYQSESLLSLAREVFIRALPTGHPCLFKAPLAKPISPAPSTTLGSCHDNPSWTPSARSGGGIRPPSLCTMLWPWAAILPLRQGYRCAIMSRPDWLGGRLCEQKRVQGAAANRLSLTLIADKVECGRIWWKCVIPCNGSCLPSKTVECQLAASVK